MTGRCGLFGKLETRRDFVSVGMPRPFLVVWEAWLQAGLVHSRDTLDPGWTPLFLTMPIWRFRFGAGLCGIEMLGALMPSMDGAGRCFPLVVVTWPEPGCSLAPAQEPWLEAAERFLMSTLEQGRRHDDILDGFGRLPPPEQVATPLPGFEPAASLWWTDGGEAGIPDKVHVTGPLTPDLMTRLITRPVAVATTTPREARHDG